MKTLSGSELRALKTGMTVADLIDELSHHDPDAVVVFACDYGDICRTQQALPVTSADELDAEDERVVGSAYSHSGLAVEDIEHDEDGEPDEYDGPEVVVLREAETPSGVVAGWFPRPEDGSHTIDHFSGVRR